MKDQRKRFESYMDQLGELKGPEVEALMQQALEAVDLLDNALALEKVRGRGGGGEQEAARGMQH